MVGGCFPVASVLVGGVAAFNLNLTVNLAPGQADMLYNYKKETQYSGIVIPIQWTLQVVELSRIT